MIVFYSHAMIGESPWWHYVVTALVVGVPALVGTGLIFAAARRWTKLRTLTASGRQTTARVVDNQLESWSDGRTSFRPVVTFQTDSGQEVTTALDDLDGFRSHIIGTEVPVIYDPLKPSDATPAHKNGGRLVTTVVFGVLFLAFAIGAYSVVSTVLDGFGDFGSSVDSVDVSDPGFDFGDLETP
ncbi:hypothetical protein GCM10010112_46010 [Actinoplanes lobatus]|uniref:DUF3592 domain-containing protein n=1 Tax=Actinoplanes lobatus TaxID=113568 RepID=A0A7W7HGE6_9ACTN|nr:DUF3592 domain-containing protein [Actinoplanes lobatus]MBB4750086.1 hypothetical protein [Actinoplanes lobatus]GGN75112.1 hypothetical protein GCM10010112_46010 [Actinoplanes lobatus]GIE39026.1 hypothetical protein Alo02nite_19240 [Actinoplanes lobatus]